ncbi:MAG: dethiobiotin synthase [Holophaga sp.]
MPAGVFVAGTGTDAGKTVVAAALALALDAHYWKPVQTGLEQCPGGDTAEVARLTGHQVEDFPPPAYAFRAPLAPDQAAAEEGADLDPAQIRLPPWPRPLVVEAAGGVLSPVAGPVLMVHLAARLGLPIVLAARTGLGTINHTLLSLEALRARGLPLVGVVLSGPDQPRNLEAIRRLGGAPVLGRIPWLEPLCADTLVRAAAGLDLRGLR